MLEARKKISKHLARVVREELAIDLPLEEIILTAPRQETFGDLATNIPLFLTNKLNLPPKEIAEKIRQGLEERDGDLKEIVQSIEVAGPGFINFRLNEAWVARKAAQFYRQERLGLKDVAKPLTVVIDFSSPNVAKPLHVGHIRSTIIGDSLTRIYRFLGHKVVTDNHLGDWGAQFGMLILGYRRFLKKRALAQDPLGELERIYKKVYDLSQEDEAIKEEARQEHAKLQSGDEENLALWKEFMQWSQREFDKIYQRLGVKFDHTLGESFYNPMLAEVVKELTEKGIARESEGAICIFFDEPELADAPFIIQRRDGAWLYPATDLATIKYRMEKFNPDLILYVVDIRQRLYFQELFAAVRRWGYKVRLEHIGFGTILGEDRTPLKTREGGLVRLEDLLDEAEKRALSIADEQNPDLAEAERQNIARAVGIGAVKYCDLSQARLSDYIFSFDRMLRLDGNTAPYLQYAYARIQSIFRKGQINIEALRGSKKKFLLQERSEIDLAKCLLRLPDAVLAAAEEFAPNALTVYLYELATRYSKFYESCPVLSSSSGLKESRVMLCDYVAKVLKLGLNLLGIEAIQRM